MKSETMNKNIATLDSIFDTCKELGMSADVLASFIKSDSATEDDILDMISTTIDIYNRHLDKLKELIPSLIEITVAVGKKED